MWIQSFESVLELLEFWEDEELVLLVHTHVVIEVASESVQVVVLAKSVVLASTAGLSSIQPVCSV